MKVRVLVSHRIEPCRKEEREDRYRNRKRGRNREGWGGRVVE
jgi:hypothetical protein